MAAETRAAPGAAGIKTEQVARLSQLSRLGLSPEEVERMRSELSVIIAAVAQLARADTGGVDPTAQIGGLHNVWRADDPEPGLSPEVALANAPVKEAGLLRVPAIQ